MGNATREPNQAGAEVKVKFVAPEENLQLMKTLDDSWNAQDLAIFHKRHAKNGIVRAQPAAYPRNRSPRTAAPGMFPTGAMAWL